MYDLTKAEYQPLSAEEEVDSEFNTLCSNSDHGKDYKQPVLRTRCSPILKALILISLSLNLSCFIVIALLLQQLKQNAGSSAWYQNDSLNPEIKASSFYCELHFQVTLFYLTLLKPQSWTK